MNYSNLRKSIFSLANLPENGAPVVSTYFDHSKPITQLYEEFTIWRRSIRQTFVGRAKFDFDAATERIQADLISRANKGTKVRASAFFSRAGEHPYFLPLTFKVPLETLFNTGSYPVIFPLVELKDRFNRFVVVLTTQDSARIIEMNLGETSLETLARRPEARERSGREWTREHYHNQGRERDRRFLKEKVAMIEQLMSKRGHNAIIIAGESRYISRLREALPKHLQEKVVDQIRTGINDERIQEILETAIESYLQVEHNESESTVKKLFRAFRTNGLAALGLAATLRALKNGQASHLVISNNLPLTSREKLVRIASQHGIPIETVRNSNLLIEQGGVGALLRYRNHPDQSGKDKMAA